MENTRIHCFFWEKGIIEEFYQASALLQAPTRQEI